VPGYWQLPILSIRKWHDKQWSGNRLVIKIINKIPLRDVDNIGLLFYFLKQWLFLIFMYMFFDNFNRQSFNFKAFKCSK
jgi:hypothetical protein